MLQLKGKKKFFKKHFLQLLITILLLLIIVLYFSQINWSKFFAYIPKLRWQYFIISTFLAVIAIFADAIVWYDFLVPLTDEYIDIKYIFGVNFLSVIIGVVVPTAGAIDIAIKLKYLTKESNLTYEKILSTIVAVRVIFLITLYPTMTIFLYIIYASGILDLELTLGLLIVVWIILTIILIVLVFMIVKVDIVNQKVIPLLLFPLKRYEKIQNYQHYLIEKTNSFAKSFRDLNGSKKYLHHIIFFTIVQWATRLVAMYLIFLVLIDIPFHIVIFSSTLSGLTTMIPAFIPGMAGIRDIVTTETLRLYSQNVELDLLTSIMNEIQILILLIMALGAFVYLQKYKHKNHIKLDNEQQYRQPAPSIYTDPEAND